MSSSNAFQQAEDEYFRLRGQLAAGRITAEQFKAAHKELMVEHEGAYWMLGANSGKWYVHDGQNWVGADPPTAPPDSSASSPARPLVNASEEAVKELDSTQQATMISQDREGAPPAVIAESLGAPPLPEDSPPTSIEQVFQTLFLQTEAKVVRLRREQVEDLARILQWVRESRVVTEDEFKTLHTAFQCADSEQTVWTVGLRSLTWHHADRGQWVADVPPHDLYLDTEWLRAVAQRVPQQSLAEVLVKLNIARQSVVCGRCGASNEPGHQFCTSCGSLLAVAAPPAAQHENTCAQCGGLIQPGEKFCTSCGARVSDFVPNRVTPVERRCPNPDCGQTVPAGNKFCTACGRRVRV